MPGALFHISYYSAFKKLVLKILSGFDMLLHNQRINTGSIIRTAGMIRPNEYSGL